MFVELVSQPIFHEIDGVEHSFILNNIKHLERNDLEQLNVFKKFMLEDVKSGNFLPKPCDLIDLVVFSHNCLHII